MGESSGSIWERIVAWFRGMFGTPTAQDGSSGSNSGGGGLGSLKNTASKAASSARDTASSTASSAMASASQAVDRAKQTADDMRGRGQDAVDRASDRTPRTDDEVPDTQELGPNDERDSDRLSGAAASATSRGYDTGASHETGDATIEDMDASGQDTSRGASIGAATGSGMTAEDLDQGGSDTAERNTGGSEAGSHPASGVTSEDNAPAEVGEGVTYSPRPGEHPEADQAATDVGSSGRPFAHEGDDWWDTDRPGMGSGSSLGEQGAGSETGTEGHSSSGDLGPSASAADVGTSSAGASFRGADEGGTNTGTSGASSSDTSGGIDAGGSGGGAGGSRAYSADSGRTAGATTATTRSGAGAGDTSNDAGAMSDEGDAASAAGDIVAGYGESGAVTADTSSVGVDSPDTPPGVGYEGSSPATDREGVGSYAPSAATGDGTGASSNDANLVQEAPDDAAARAADQANAAHLGDASDDLYADTAAPYEASDANAGTDFEAMPDDRTDYSTAQDIVVGGLIAEDEQETGGDFADEIYVDAETQQTELPAADYEDTPTDTASTTEDVTTTLGDQTTPAPAARERRAETGTTGRGVIPDASAGSEAAYEASYGAPRDAGAEIATRGVGEAEGDANAPTVGTRGVNWVPGDGGTTAPQGFPLKGNASSMIYHPRESSTYDRTIAEYYFATPEDAEAAGYRLPKSLQKAGEASARAAESAVAGAREAASGTNGPDTATSGGSVPAGDMASASTDAATTAAPPSQAGAAPAGQTAGTGKQASGRQERPAPKGAIRAQGANCPGDYPIKGNANSRIYHLPTESSYEQTIPEFCFATEADAKSAGFRARKH